MPIPRPVTGHEVDSYKIMLSIAGETGDVVSDAPAACPCQKPCHNAAPSRRAMPRGRRQAVHALVEADRSRRTCDPHAGGGVDARRQRHQVSRRAGAMLDARCSCCSDAAPHPLLSEVERHRHIAEFRVAMTLQSSLSRCSATTHASCECVRHKPVWRFTSAMVLLTCSQPTPGPLPYPEKLPG